MITAILSLLSTANVPQRTTNTSHFHITYERRHCDIPLLISPDIQAVTDFWQLLTHQWPLLPNSLVQTLIISHMHTCSATQITVGSQGDTLQTVSRFFLGPDEYSGLELRISTSIKSTSNLGDSKQRQVRETLEHVFSVLIHYLKKKKKLARFNIIDHCWYRVQWWSQLLKSKDFKLTNHIPGSETWFCLKMHTGWRPNTFISIQVSP